ncbi:hypothetical protein CDN99_05915 [Roseateles aquatilis]|uniref:Uncharacterized protein n=2 Tax=Roseateles aquatilis TaxID=431061 RepID=A0A246JH74_9BURK|nr:hypothetical protein CDN99_05915 [Roseateles aquatilis]
MVGTPGAISEEENAARKVFRDWSRNEVFRALPTANPEGKLYLLCVVRRRFPDRYAEAKALAGLAQDQQVSVFSGSVLRKVLASDLIGQFERSACEPLSWPQDPAPKGG